MGKNSDTIAAQATAPGRGGVGIIRVSGGGVFNIAKQILDKEIKPKSATFCNFLDKNKKTIDEGIAIYFVAPNSFTGEDVLELHGHGGCVIMDLLLGRVLELGARIAAPGEFTQRAFLNNKLDLVQAEAVADLISASTSQAAQNAVRSLQGEFSGQINKIVEQLTALRVGVEAAIDFAEEGDIKEFEPGNIKIAIGKILFQIEDLKSMAKQGLILQDGITVVITGAPNAGKSSLLNCLSGQDTAIVTDVPGTTRDVLRSMVQIDGLPVHILDTAGMHDRPGEIEEEGIRRAWKEIEKADHVLLVIDGFANKTRDPEKQALDFLRKMPAHSRLTVLYNKIDLTKEDERVVLGGDINSIYISTKTGCGFELLRRYLRDSVGGVSMEGGFSARRRHLDALLRAEKQIYAVQQKLLEKNYLEMVAEDLRLSQNILGEITGEVVVDDLLGKIFSEFCVGK